MMCSGANLPDGESTVITLWPVASIAPVSWTAICPLSTVITAWCGRKTWEIVVRLVIVPPLKNEFPH